MDRTIDEHPRLLHTVLDTTEPRALAEFYRQLLGLRYRQGDEPPEEADWLVLVDIHGIRKLAFQRVERLPPTTWPTSEVPMQLHLDLTVSSLKELHRQRERAASLGGHLLLDRSSDPEEPLYVLADLAGHPFCILVA